MDVVYSFVNEEMTVFELKNTVAPDDCPKSQKYQWFVADDRGVNKLTFVSSTDSIVEQIREFQGASLRFSERMEKAYFTDDRGVHELYRLK